MKNPHDKNNYKSLDTVSDKPDNADTVAQDSERSQTEQPEQLDNAAASGGENAQAGAKPQKTKKPKFSGAYYYVDKDEGKLATMSFVRTSLTIAAFILQVLALIPKQAGALYVSKHVTSLALFYVIFTVFGLFGVSIWLFVMNQIRYKFDKRIPIEYAPKNGFKSRAYFGLELYMAVNAMMCVFELVFVCIKFDGWGLGVFFICLVALAASVGARQVCHITLRSAELIQAQDTDTPGA